MNLMYKRHLRNLFDIQLDTMVLSEQSGSILYRLISHKLITHVKHSFFHTDFE